MPQELWKARQGWGNSKAGSVITAGFLVELALN